jgi:hypothetical protein
MVECGCLVRVHEVYKYEVMAGLCRKRNIHAIVETHTALSSAFGGYMHLECTIITRHAGYTLFVSSCGVSVKCPHGRSIVGYMHL